jgi:UDP-N-acetylglucosamine 2-epimerase (non-hydrolysing)
MSVIAAQAGKRPLLHVVGARPNFMKLAPVFIALQGRHPQQIVHTGQHYDRGMSDSFFEVLGLPEPDYNLGVGSGSHAEQTARVMLGLDQLCDQLKPAAFIVYGDVNSTVAGALVASKRGIPCVHVEAGLRSGDRSMPEELNRLVTDQLSDILLTHSVEATDNLLREGIPRKRVFFVGNVMIDTLKRMLPQARTMKQVGIPERFALVTIHRPSNVDEAAKLGAIAGYLQTLSQTLPVVFPIHPRTRARLKGIRFDADPNRIVLMEPLDYLRFIQLQKRATFVITDSGGVQEETTFLGTPCLTLRTTTERPVTVDIGTNTLVGEDPSALEPHVQQILAGQYKKGSVPDLWDGEAGSRIANIVSSSLS